MGNTAKADYYKNIILNEHGDTEYAEIIRNPNYAIDRANRKSALDIFYEDTYRKYLNGEYNSVIMRKAQSDNEFPGNPLVAKFDLLKTLSIGRTQPLPVFEASLNDIIRNHSTDSVRYMAQDILDYIHTKNETPDVSVAPPVIANDTTDANKKIYSYMPDTLHYAVLIFQNIGGPLKPDRIKNKLSDFNQLNFGSKGLTMQDFLFDHRNLIILLKTFSNKQEALQYTSTLFDNDAVFGQVPSTAYQLFAISVNNLPTLLARKKTEVYDDFYRHFYR